jgi:hypothetical protein
MKMTERCHFDDMTTREKADARHRLLGAQVVRMRKRNLHRHRFLNRVPCRITCPF